MLHNFPLILLAGGKSSRMGIPKGLLDYRGNYWLLEQLTRFKAASGKRAIVVLGFHTEEYFDKIPWLRAAQTKPLLQLGLEISAVVNPYPEQGQFSSLLCALSMLSIKNHPSAKHRTSNTEGVFSISGAFILPIDVPGPTREIYKKMAVALKEEGSVVLPRCQSKGGHPVLLSPSFCSHLLSLDPVSPEARLDVQIKALPGDRLSIVPVTHPDISLNLNIQEDFKRYKENLPHG
jgi:CTP:molybdopterin cytidylyltransferase MocA